jgi:hypothetical protein
MNAISFIRTNTLSTVSLAELRCSPRWGGSADLLKLHGLFLEHLFHITDLALHLTTCFFHGTSVAQIWIPRCLAGLFFHFPLGFVEGAFDLIFCARFHKESIARQALNGLIEVVMERSLSGAGAT